MLSETNACRVCVSGNKISQNIVNVQQQCKSSETLNEQERIEIIHKLSKPNPPSKCSIGWEYNISEGSVRYI